MNIKQFGAMLTAGALITLSVNPVYATVCNQPSPLQELLGEEYWDIGIAMEKANLATTPDEPDAHVVQNIYAGALAVLDKFDTRHYTSGYGKRYECTGVLDRARLVEFDSELNLNPHSPSAHEKTETGQRLEFIENGENKAEEKEYIRILIVELPVATQWQLSSTNSISTTFINRRANRNGGTRLQHIDTELELTSRGIRLSQTLYVNGHRASWADWTLVK